MLRRTPLAFAQTDGAYICKACRNKRLQAGSQFQRSQCTSAAVGAESWIEQFKSFTDDILTQHRRTGPFSKTLRLEQTHVRQAYDTNILSEEPVGSNKQYEESRETSNKLNQVQRSVREGKIGINSGRTANVTAALPQAERPSQFSSITVSRHRRKLTQNGSATQVAHSRLYSSTACPPNETQSSAESAGGILFPTERLPLDATGRRRKPPFKVKTAIKQLGFIPRPTVTRTKRSLAQRAEASNARLGWAGLATQPDVVDTALVGSDDAHRMGELESERATLRSETQTTSEISPTSSNQAVNAQSGQSNGAHDATTPTRAEKNTANREIQRKLMKRRNARLRLRRRRKEREHMMKTEATAVERGQGEKLNTEKPKARKSKAEGLNSKITETEGLKAEKSRTEATNAGEAKTVKSLADKPKKAKIKTGNEPETNVLPKKKSKKSSAYVRKVKSTARKSRSAVVRARNTAAYELEQLVIRPKNLKLIPVDIEQPAVPSLSYGLDRILFNQGVYQLQDPHSRVYNFDPYLQKIMPVTEFDFGALKQYKTSSQDETLAAIATETGKKYIGSTSSMTSTLAHFHFLLSNFRDVNLDMLSKGFAEQAATFTRINLAPNAIFLRWKNGTYAIDADKEHDGANVLMMLGKSMEKLLTSNMADFERYRKGNSQVISLEERDAPEAFHYTTMGDFLMRSQLDAYDRRLPGTGMFDLKTRAVVSVRMDAEDFQPMSDYEIHTLQGRWESYEREYYDMIRSTMLKYMLQVRIGRMDGIFVAYHNVKRIFGFQYVSLSDMDRALHGQTEPCLGDQEFRASVDLLNKIFDKATKKFPGQSLRFHFETRQENLEGVPAAVMWVFAEPMPEEDIKRIQNSNKAKIAEFERNMMGIERDEGSDVAGDSTTEPPLDTVLAKHESEPVETAEDSKSETVAVASAEESSADSENVANPSSAESEPADKRPLAPLFVASVIVRSLVNGDARSRPERLRESQIWDIEYLIQEWEADESWWARYEQTKARRKEVLSRERDRDEEVVKEALSSSDDPEKKAKKEKKPDGYIQFLQRLSAKGKKFRGQRDAEDEGKVPIVVGMPVPGESPAAEGDVISTDDYLSWLYDRSDETR